MASLSAARASPGVRRGPPMPAMPSVKAPAPRPSSSRPPDSTSTVAACLASMAGGRSGRLATFGKKRTREVPAASQVISEKVSRNPALYGWSWIPTRSRPAESAMAAIRAAMACPPALGSTFRPNMAGWVMIAPSRDRAPPARC